MLQQPFIVEELSNELLAQLVLRLLWIKQDAGGESFGRSRQNALLEKILFKDFPIPAKISADLRHSIFVFQEAQKRVGEIRQLPLAEESATGVVSKNLSNKAARAHKCIQNLVNLCYQLIEKRDKVPYHSDKDYSLEGDLRLLLMAKKLLETA